VSILLPSPFLINIQNTSIRTKLIVGLSVMVLALIIVSWRGVAGMSALNLALERSLTDDFIPARIVANANSGLIALNRAVLNHMFATDSLEMQTFNTVIIEQRSYVQEQLNKLLLLNLRPNGKEKLLNAITQFKYIEPIIAAVLKNSRRDQQQNSADIIRLQLRPEVDQLDRLMSSFLLLQETQLDNSLALRYETYNTEVERIWTITGLVLLLIIVYGWNLVLGITRPLAELTRAAANLSTQTSSYPKPLTVTGNDEIGILTNAFNHMADKLTQSIITLQLSETQIIKLNKQQQRQILEIDIVNKDLESFTYSASHDLRQPLRSISGFSQLLQNKYKDQLDEQARHYLQRVVVAAKGMSELIDDLLGLSRISQTRLSPTSVDLTNLCKDVIKELKGQQPEYKADILIAKGLQLLGDKKLIQILITNLLRNAFKFTSYTDHPRIEVTAEKNEDEVIFSVRDNGVGFDMNYADKLFLPFQRLHRASEFDGSGIGLAIVERIVRRHNGRVWADSQVGEGATLFFTVPTSSDLTKDNKL
jgi:signal transduction histidine kinase